ncbi:PEP-CTERM sorting domain-containing protein [Thalassotalea mangrovi]|uniref:PEP-CTERM sorting domain-containing protein n=1 Tax=Thalassotalea mangrovi TaxID=2572245 RepID=A0A4U1B7C5_9GAMM|nr:PEP-CTERM sorting domain-containing protein [Thalassotalea mangrovi]TKB46119.1 PEP-CTERM sorting domain-containing protein [Thalassotalea mangrovi]
MPTLLVFTLFTNAAFAQYVKILDFSDTDKADEKALGNEYVFSNDLIKVLTVTFKTSPQSTFWLDSDSGLGICTSSNCKNNPDDGITEGEWFEFSFSVGNFPFFADDILLVFTGHETYNGIEAGEIRVSTGQIFQISNVNSTAKITGAKNGYRVDFLSGDMYLESLWIFDNPLPPTESIPEPSNLMLFITALGIMSRVRRRKP